MAGSILLFVFVVALGPWGELLCRAVLQAAGSRSLADWQVAGLIAASPLPPLVATSLV